MTGPRYNKDDSADFTVWAPEKESMLLHIVHPADQKLTMDKNEDGYFTVHVHNIKAGCRYFFMPDGEKNLPDPASNCQPDDVFGASELIDHQAFEWTDIAWKGLPFKDLLLYELHVGTFTQDGTFEAIIPFLDDMINTGINAIELMPVCQFSGSRNWGYDGVYPYAVHQSYGGPKGLKTLVNACHQKGIAVFLDVVYNHLGPEANHLGEYGPYFTDKYCTPWGDALNFDDAWSDGVRDYFSDNPLYWFEYFHIDGLRLDAVHFVFDTGAVSIWQMMHEKIRLKEQELGRKLYMTAESDYNSPKVTKHPDAGGMGFTAQWLDDFHHILYVLLDRSGQERYTDFAMMEQLAKAYTDGFVHSGEFVQFRQRKHGAPSAGVPGDQFIVFNMNHDQVGNRIGGERLSVLVSFEKQKLAAAALMLSPYIPMLFMGEEYGEDTPFFYFISHHNKDLVKMVQEGRYNDFKKFGLKEGENFPDPQDEEIFNRSKLQWHKRKEGRYNILLQWNTLLIRLRRSNSILCNFNKNNVKAFALAQDGLVVHRQSEDGKEHLMCCFNFSDKDITYQLPSYTKQWKKLIDSKEAAWMFDEAAEPHVTNTAANEAVIIHPCGVVVYTTQPCR